MKLKKTYSVKNTFQELQILTVYNLHIYETTINAQCLQILLVRVKLSYNTRLKINLLLTN